MLSNIFIFFCWGTGLISFIALDYETATDNYFSHLSVSIGLILLASIQMQIRASHYAGGAATFIALIMSFLALIGIVTQVENYVRFREYLGIAVLIHGLLMLAAIFLFLTGHRMHKMKQLITTQADKAEQAD